MKPFVLLGALALAAALVGGCENKTPRPKVESSAGTSAGASAPRSEVRKDADKQPSAEDEALTAQVKSALTTQAPPGAKDIEVDSNAGVVVLKGHVAADEAKKRIHEIAQKVPGVKWVHNQISVTPPPPASSG